MRQILIVDNEYAKYQEYLEPKFPEVDFACAVDGDSAKPFLPKTEVIISICHWLTKEVVEKSPNLKWVQCNITGIDHLKDVLGGRPDILLTNGRGIHGPQMTEITLLHMLALYRQIRRLASNQSTHTWDRFLPHILDTSVVAILGLGSIAEHMARCFKALGMTVYGISRTRREISGIDHVFLRDQIVDAVAEADFVVVLLPYSSETAKIVNSKIFDAMKPSACLINVARGGVVDEEALINALETGKIAGAGLDVFETSPLPKSSPLWDLDNVFITPFVGGRSNLYAERILTVIEPNLKAYLNAELNQMINVVEW